jgi:predicted Rossmann fold flavoprotein
MNRDRVIVIGGGAAGLMAAGQAAGCGRKVVLLEKMTQPGRKIGISGKGRCNLTNIAELSDFIQHFGANGRFLHQAFARFFAPELIAFFEGIGLPLSTERGGRVFPTCGRALEVRKVLVQWLERQRVEIRCNAAVDSLLIEGQRIRGVVCGGKAVEGGKVVLATGGASYPRTGSTGDGYRLAAQAGHSIIPIRPALVPLETAGDLAKRMAGLSLKNIEARLFIDGKRQSQAFGELSFTGYGLSGPLVLTFSNLAVDSLRAGRKVVLALDLKPALSEAQLELRLQRDFCGRAGEPVASVLRALLPREMLLVCLEENCIDPKKPANEISNQERRTLRTWLKDFRLTVTGHRSFDEAIVTAGGVDLREIDPRTMESRTTRGLFIAGELLDLHADTGGYNLQAAFSTGWLAGQDRA